MILLKAAILFVLANPAEFYPLTEQEAWPCGLCSFYIDTFRVPEYPNYDKLLEGQSLKDCLKKHNKEYLCGQANEKTSSDMKNNNITIAKSSKVMGGSETEPNEFPWQVAIAYGLGRLSPLCGGSIISSKEILTAAHCVQGETYNFVDGLEKQNVPIKDCLYAVVGEYDRSEPRDGELFNRICDVKIHPSYKGKYIKDNVQHDESNNDYAVLMMCRELIFNKQVSPVCLPIPNLNAKPTENEYQLYLNEQVTGSGWGHIDNTLTQATKLKKIQLKVLSNSVCFGKYWPKEQSDVSKICAINKEVGNGMAKGDSGGPLVIQNSKNKLYTIIGVTSGGYKTVGTTKWPDRFARVTVAMGWINKPGVIVGTPGKNPDMDPPEASGAAACSKPKTIKLRKDSKNSRSLKNSGGVTYYHFEKDKKLSRKKAQEICISKEQVKDLKMFGQIAIGGQWKDKSSRKFEWTDESEMDMSVLNANWFRTRNYQFPSYKNKKRINLELWYSRRALGFANALDHKAPTMYICKVAPSCSA